MIEKAYLSDNRVTHISQSFTHKMAAKTSWHRYGTKLRHCHPVYLLHFLSCFATSLLFHLLPLMVSDENTSSQSVSVKVIVT